MAYLFLAIGIGLGFGADQRAITLVAFAIIDLVLWLRSFANRSEEGQNLCLTIASHGAKVELGQIVEALKKHCSAVNMRRFDETEESIEASFLVDFDGFSQLEGAKAELYDLNASLKITFLDSKGLF